jgi:hypothetical protein
LFCTQAGRHRSFKKLDNNYRKKVLFSKYRIKEDQRRNTSKKKKKKKKIPLQMMMKNDFKAALGNQFFIN